MSQIAKVAVDAATYAIDKPYDYLAPEELHIQIGARVLVPFGRGNRLCEGIVLALSDSVSARPMKAIRENLDPEPLLTAKDLKLAFWMVKRYFCTFYDAIHSILPAAVWYRYSEWWTVKNESAREITDREKELFSFLEESKRETEEVRKAFGNAGINLLHKMQEQGLVESRMDSRAKVRDKVISFVSLCLTGEEAKEMLRVKGKRSPRMEEAVDFLVKNGETALNELCYFTGVSRSAVDKMVLRGILAMRWEEAYRIRQRQYTVKAEPIVLNPQQQEVLESVLAEIESGQPGVTLLKGVTGSGKTLIYIRLAQELLKRGQSVMILVPEIALTPQIMALFSAYFGNEVALLHSGLRLTERYDQWKRLKKGEAHIVLGTRSAVFAPLDHIGLFVMDEEQESSYESENAPCYHARDIAKFRCAQEGAHLLLGSATPTVESAFYASRGDYHLALLRQRYNERSLPEVVIADMRKELRDGNIGVISRELYEELKKNLERGEQSILFLNRRGSSRQMQCTGCGYVFQCPRCSV